jgi:cobalamin biosynthesis protein CobD/CbiB
MRIYLLDKQWPNLKFGIDIAIHPVEPIPKIMETREKRIRRRDFFQAYVSQINWDWLFLKGQFVFLAIILFGLAAFLLWFVQ